MLGETTQLNRLWRLNPANNGVGAALLAPPKTANDYQQKTKVSVQVSDKVRYGVIGTGMMGIEHICNIAAIDDTAVVAISDPWEGSRNWALDTIEQQGGDRSSVEVYEDHRQLLSAGACDAVVVASPNMTHIDVALDVVEAGVPMLLEKPMCTTVEDSQRLVDAVSGSEAMVWVGLEYRYMPPISRLIDEVKSGTVGQVHMVAIREHRFPFLRKVGDWNRFNRNTGGTLVEKCCHFFDLMYLLAGAEPTRVMASGGQSVNHLDEAYDGEVPDIADNAFVIVDFANGVRGMLDLCMFAEGSKNEQEIAVTGDIAKVEAFVPEAVMRIADREAGQGPDIDIADPSITYEGFHHGSSLIEHRAFLEAVRNGGDPEVTVRDGLRSVQMGAAAHESINTGTIITL